MGRLNAMRHRLVPLLLAGVITSGATVLSIGLLASASPGNEPCAEAPVTSAPPDSAVDPPDDDRCAIDAEAYYLGYESPDYDVDSGTNSNVAPLPPGLPATAAPSAQNQSNEVLAEAGDGAVANPGPYVPVLPDEPGLLEDNTFVDAGDSGWVATGDDRESTFALDVDTGSLSVAEAFLAQGYRPEPDSIRAEEWINSFHYGDAPATDGALDVSIESAAGAGTADDPALVRVGVTTSKLDAQDRPAANITFVIDTSGSMDIRERLGLVKSSLALLVKNLRLDDTISIVTYGDEASPLLEPTPVSEWEDIVDAIDSLQPGGSTNMEAGLRLGYEQAREGFDPDALNVVVLASDGVANQGVTDADELTADITQAGEEGIHLVTVGFGMGNFNDHLMEQLANQGDGFYSYVDTFEQAVELFVTDLTPTLTVVAEEAKVQVVFDPDVVASYRLIGYENRALDDSQFSDDTVDAGELGAGHQVSAVYELELVDGAETTSPASPGTVRLRWADPETGEVTELDEDIELTPVTDGATASPTLRFAALVGHVAELLKGSPAVTERGLTLDDLLDEAEALAGDGVDGAGEIVELLTVAINAEPATTAPITTEDG